jgi:putative alpha-1,2-mannosidase
MEKLYKPTPDGYCGDEDNGQTSAWYVFSAMGFYPVCPETTQYVFGTQLFKKITVTLDNGKKVEIEAPKASVENKYVSQVKWNGIASDKNWVDHFELLKGGKLQFEMVAQPNKQRGTTAKSYPYSYSRP